MNRMTKNSNCSFVSNDVYEPKTRKCFASNDVHELKTQKCFASNDVHELSLSSFGALDLC